MYLQWKGLRISKLQRQMVICNFFSISNVNYVQIKLLLLLNSYQILSLIKINNNNCVTCFFR